MNRSLLVGLDLCNDLTQIAVYNKKTFEPDLIGATEENPDGVMESIVIMQNDTEMIKGFISSIQNGNPILRDGKPIDEVKLLSYYFRKLLSLVKNQYPAETILQLVITVEEQEMIFVDKIYAALEEIGIGRDRATVIDHKQSYLYYALCQEKDLWMSDVGMFEYGEKGLFYYQINIERRRSPILAGINKRDYTEAMILHKEEGNETAVREAIFENIVRSAIHRQVISTLYMTGKGFDGGWANEVLQRLCVGRRVFVGKNLYVSGACYAARELSGQGKLEEFVFLDDDMIAVHITTNVYVDAEIKEVILAKAGTPWYQAGREVDLIPDSEEELTISVKHILRRETTNHMITLEGIKGRTNRMARIGVKIQFADTKTCIITIKDKGFGDFMPSSNRIWERTITIK